MAYARFEARKDFSPPVSDLATDLASFGDPQLDQAAAALRFPGGILQWYMAGLTWESGPYQAQAMLSHVSSDRIVMPSNWAGLVSLGYRVGQVVPYGLWSRVGSKEPQVPDLGDLYASGDPSAAALADMVTAMVLSVPSNQSTVAAGLRWDFRTSMDFKFQVDRIQSRNRNTLWDQIQPQWNGRATVLTAVVDFVF